MKAILGSGLIGNIAKSIYPDWEWIPFKRSRYYSTPRQDKNLLSVRLDPPYADYHIAYDKAIDAYMTSQAPGTPIFQKRPISYSGQLMFQDLPLCKEPYLRKVYGSQIPTLASSLLKTAYTTYQIPAHALLYQLDRQNKLAIDAGMNKYGEVISINLQEHVIKTSKGNFEFDQLINTIPLDALHQYCGLPFTLQAQSVCYYHIITEAVDLEGAEQCLVADGDIKFFRVTAVPSRKHHYLFWTFEVIDNPYQYFGNILNFQLEFDVPKRIDNVIPIGDPPDLKYLEEYKIYCVGSNAQWDDFMDVASCIKRLLSLVGRV